LTSSRNPPGCEGSWGPPPAAGARVRGNRWAFAEILKGRPFAERAALSQIEALVTAQAGRDAARREFVQLFERAKPLLR
jgi:hypothetical protein